MKYRHYNDMNVWSFLSVHKKSCSKYFYMIDSIIILWKQGFVNPIFFKMFILNIVVVMLLKSLYCIRCIVYVFLNSLSYTFTPIILIQTPKHHPNSILPNLFPTYHFHSYILLFAFQIYPKTFAAIYSTNR